MLGKSVQEIAISKKDFDKVGIIAQALMDNKYVVMLSYEEELVIINYTYGCDIHSDRNEVAFMSLDELEDNYYQIVKEEEE